MTGNLRLRLALFAVLAVVSINPVCGEVLDPFEGLIGKPAPDFAPTFALNGEKIDLEGLKGKVVLLDFWAPWCLPCRATFPYLVKWRERYQEKGLEIVGLTSYYKRFAFDKESGKFKQLAEEMTAEQEQAMLKDFAEHFKLKHLLTVVTPTEMRRVGEAYRVKGIPTAVLIDRKGNARLAKVGSGEAIAKEIESMINVLLKEEVSADNVPGN